MLRCLWVTVFLFAVPSLHAADFSSLTEKEKSKVEAGGLVVHAASVQGSYAKEIHAFLRIQAPTEKVFSLITNYQILPSFMPNLERIEVLSQDDTGAVANYYLDLPFGVHKQYRLKLAYNKQPDSWRMTWHKLDWQGLASERTIADTTGYWDLQVLDGQTTQLHYYTKTDPGHVPFGLGWLVDYLTEETVVDLLKNTKKEAEKQRRDQQQ